MKEIATIAQDPDTRQSLIKDCTELIESEVQSKKGVSGMAVKTAFAMMKALRPGIIAASVDRLFDEFVAQIQPFYEAYQRDGESGTLNTYLGSRADAVAESMLVVTDRRAEYARNRTLLKAYRKLRPRGKEHVVAAIPKVGALLDRYVARL